MIMLLELLINRALALKAMKRGKSPFAMTFVKFWKSLLKVYKNTSHFALLRVESINALQGLKMVGHGDLTLMGSLVN